MVFISSQDRVAHLVGSHVSLASCFLQLTWKNYLHGNSGNWVKPDEWKDEWDQAQNCDLLGLCSSFSGFLFFFIFHLLWHIAGKSTWSSLSKYPSGRVWWGNSQRMSRISVFPLIPTVFGIFFSSPEPSLLRGICSLPFLALWCQNQFQWLAQNKKNGDCNRK